jgi:hypothetical protein
LKLDLELVAIAAAVILSGLSAASEGHATAGGHAFGGRVGPDRHSWVPTVFRASGTSATGQGETC